MCECLPLRGVELKKQCVCGHFCVVFMCVCVCPPEKDSWADSCSVSSLGRLRLYCLL